MYFANLYVPVQTNQDVYLMVPHGSWCAGVLHLYNPQSGRFPFSCDIREESVALFGINKDYRYARVIDDCPALGGLGTQTGMMLGKLGIYLICRSVCFIDVGDKQTGS